MTYNPLSEVIDEPLSISPDVILKLEILRASEKFIQLPGTDIAAEQARLSVIFDDLLDRLIAGLSEHPNKLWVMGQFQPALEAVSTEDTEAREHFGIHIERLMDILKIESSDGLLGFYL